MAGKSRSLNFILLVCALIGAAWFFGCSGGGNSSDPIPVPIMQISGTVKSSTELGNMAYDGNLLPDVRAQFAVPGVTVWLESDYNKSTTTDANGNFVLSGIAVGSHRLVARINAANGKTYKVISAPITVSERVAEVVAPQLDLKQATIAVSGKIKKADDTGLPNARMTLWGEPFTADSNGQFTTLPMLEGTTEQLVISNSGYQNATVDVKFVENAPFIEQAVVVNSSTNRAPSVTMQATKYAVDRLYEINFTAVATDPDNNLATFTWLPTAGNFSADVASDTFRTWVAPNADTVATITFTAIDNGGLKAAASIFVKVGRGIVVPNAQPTVGEITVSPGDLAGNRNYTLSVVATDSNGDALTYNWVATSTSGNIGNLNSKNSSSITWFTPNATTSTNVTVTVNVNDLRENGLVSKSKTFTVAPTAMNQAPTNLAIDILDINSVATTTVYAYRDYILKGSATDPEGETISWQWSGKGTLYTPTATTTRWLTPSTPQSAEMTLTVTDVKGASSNVKRTFTILDSGLARPTVSITASPSARIIKVGENISFDGLASSSAGANILPENFKWSETDGTYSPTVIFSGVKQISRAYIKPATYTISLEALDYAGVPGTSEYSFRVNATPTASITSPLPGAAFNQYATVSFGATANDVEDGAISADSHYIWTFPAPKGVVTGRSLSFADLATGTYAVQLSVMDSLGTYSATSSVQIQINENAKPVATITQPINNASSPLGLALTFSATASDSEDGNIVTPGSFNWLFPDPINATTGTSITVTNLPVSTQTISLRVKDSKGLFSATQTVSVYVNQPPQISDISPASGSNKLLNETITFSASILDEEGAIPSSKIRWQSGATLLGLGSEIQISTLTAGLHTITLSATDRRNATTATSTGIFINERPVMTIIQPATTISVGLNEKITFEGSGTDTVGTVGINSFRWYDYGYRRGGAIPGTPFVIGERQFVFDGYTSSNDFGSHTITLEGADQHGATGFITREIFVNSPPSISMTSPASGTRLDTNTSVTFSAMVYEDDSFDNLAIRWYADSYPSAVLATEIATSSPSGKAMSYTTSALASGSHTIFCEVTDAWGLKAVASTGVFINRLPYATNGKITISTTQYATTTAEIPIFMSTQPNMEIGFKIDDFDFEIGGSINNFKPGNIKWLWKSETQPDWTAFVTSNGSTATQTFKYGYNEVAARLYDSFYPEFEHQASSTYKIAFYVWNSTSITNICNQPVDMFVKDNSIYLASKAGTGGVFYYELKNSGDAYPNILADMTKNVDLATGPYNPVYACSLTKTGKISILGLNSTPANSLVSFEQTGTPTYHVFPELAGATSLAFSADETLAYVSASNKIVTFKPSSPSWSAVGEQTDADGKAFGTLGRIRFSASSGFADQVFVADPSNKRIVRYFTNTLSGAQSVQSDLSPIDMAATPKRMLILNSNSQFSLHAVDNASSSVLLTFGGTTTSGQAGKFNNPVAVYYSSNCILVLEAGNVDGNRRIQIIRSGLNDILK